MTIRIAIATIVGCTLLAGAIGASLGYGVGTLAPSYYRGLFYSGREEWFDPVSVGVGLGLSQGTAVGVVVGLAVVALLCWRDTRFQRGTGPPPQPDGQVAPVGSATRRLLLITGSLLVLGFCLSSGVVVGRLLGEGGAYHRRYLEEREALAPALAADPAFAGVEIREQSKGGMYLRGDVSTPADLERLRGITVRAVGEARAKEVMRSVRVRQ